MKTKNIEGNDGLEKIVRLLEDSKRLSNEELIELLQDDDAMAIFKDLQNCKNAVIRRNDLDIPDVEEEWKLFCKKEHLFSKAVNANKPLTYKAQFKAWKIVFGVAASLIFIFLAWFGQSSLPQKSLVVFESIDSVQQVMLQTSSGSLVALNKNTRDEDLKADNITLCKSDTLELAYALNNKNNKQSDAIETHLLTTPRGQDFKITLEDGTIVWMNSESRLEYPSRFTGKERIVNLQGEAYFSVAQNKDFPFIVCTENMQVRVLGTELNIRSNTSHDSHVALINGKAEVLNKKNKNKDSFVSLKPGENAQWLDNGSFAISNIDTDKYVYWKEGYFYFDEIPLVDVMHELGRWYDFGVVFENKDMMNLNIRFFCIRGEDIERAVTLLNHMKKFNVTISEDTVYIN